MRTKLPTLALLSFFSFSGLALAQNGPSRPQGMCTRDLTEWGGAGSCDCTPKVYKKEFRLCFPSNARFLFVHIRGIVESHGGRSFVHARGISYELFLKRGVTVQDGDYVSVRGSSYYYPYDRGRGMIAAESIDTRR